MYVKVKIDHVVRYAVNTDLALQRVFVVGDGSRAEVVGLFPHPVVVQRVGAQGSGLVGEHDMPESLDELVVARVEHLVAAKGQGIAFVDKYIPGGKERVLRAVVFGLVAGHQGIPVEKTHIADEFLHARSEILVVADQIGIVDTDAGRTGVPRG